MSADGRFAPSPTGPLHLGSLRTALVAWLMARSQGGRFLVRVEDLDPERSRREYEDAQLADLRALGLDWDEAPLRQSERRAAYDAAVAALKAGGHLYPCFCTRAEIREAASAPHGELPEGFYPGTCRGLSAGERARRIAAGERFALRVSAHGERIGWRDRLFGEYRGPVDDFVVVRTDGVHAYQLAVVVDDGAQRIGEVVRGADLVDSTPRQILLQRLLGLPTPRYLHVPLVLGPSGARLAKRDGGATLAERTEPVTATLARIAHSLGLAQGREHVGSARELVAEFTPERIPREPLHL
ncbi:MAG TPA: tRNA glutamyl-Q(34) synthetase GluQRS [Solirubrobacteraceae bacterium]|nr:tRNA glutamyl-Q(34) synthetase GluQRS [Solirubrobacteraceae bacterium]